jgi:hypothetical protein
MKHSEVWSTTTSMCFDVRCWVMISNFWKVLWSIGLKTIKRDGEDDDDAGIGTRYGYISIESAINCIFSKTGAWNSWYFLLGREVFEDDNAPNFEAVFKLGLEILRQNSGNVLNSVSTSDHQVRTIFCATCKLFSKQVRTFFCWSELISPAQMSKMPWNSSVTVLFEENLGFDNLDPRHQDELSSNETWRSY